MRRSIALRHSKREREAWVSDGSKLSGLGVVAATEAIAHRTSIDRVAALQGARVPHQRVGHDALTTDADRTIEALAAAAGWTAAAADPTGCTPREMAQEHAIGTRRHSVHH
ncbi:MAG: hypothetical protein WBG57_09220 [Ornithinimicrobium sp.]